MVSKLKRNGKVSWYYSFRLTGSSRKNVVRAEKRGFATKQAAIAAEAERRIDEQKRAEIAKATGAGVAAAPPKTLAGLLQEFMARHAVQKLAPKTAERYGEYARYLAPEILAMPLGEITPMHLSREWDRLLKSGGHTRKTKEPRPMSAKTVRNIAGTVSSAFSRAIRWGLVAANPATHSEPPVPEKHIGVALTTAQQDLVFASACGPWCMKTFLVVCAGIGARRGEVLALRWSDIVAGVAMICRSLTQTRTVLEFKSVKNKRPHAVRLDDETLAALEEHRRIQDGHRAHFGSDYRADLDLVFASQDGSPLRPNSISGTVSRIFKLLHLPKGASLHSMRHSMASQMLQEGIPLPVVSARLGHSSIRTTAEIYSHMMQGADAEATIKWAEARRRNRAIAGAPAVGKEQLQ